MDNSFLIGEKIYLRSLLPEDAEGNYRKWFNDKEVTKYMVNGTFPMTHNNIAEWIKHSNESKNDLILAICDKNSEKHIGNIGIHRIDWISRSGEYGIIIGEKDYWGKGCASEASKLIINYVFGYFDLHKIWLGVFSEHHAAIALYKKLGFNIEGEIKDAIFKNFVYHNKTLMGLINEGGVL